MSANMIAGYHDIYWMPFGTSSGAVVLGATGPDGVELVETPNEFAITGDALGPNTIVDHVNQGGNLVLSFTIQEPKLTIVKQFLNCWTAGDGTPTYGEFRIPTPGALASIATAGTLQLMPRTGTPAAAYMASGGQGLQMTGIPLGPRRHFLDTRPRFIPIIFQCYPFSDSGTMRWAKRITAVS